MMATEFGDSGGVLRRKGATTGCSQPSGGVWDDWAGLGSTDSPSGEFMAFRPLANEFVLTSSAEWHA